MIELYQIHKCYFDTAIQLKCILIPVVKIAPKQEF
ncbi:MAG: hypothetical protein K0R50_4107 [Eubacterium sp.]|nr:hypothetical protein [Eubacterium sp.]